MDNRELDAMMAERVMGQPLGMHDMGPEPPYYYLVTTNEHDMHLPVPAYSDDISAAWQVVMKMIADGWEFDLQYTNVNETEGEPLEYQWWCSFIYYTDDENDHRYESAQGTTAPEAICLVALKAVEDK